MRTTTSLRLPNELRERLAAQATDQGTTLTALVERYAREGLASDRHPGVTFKSGPSGRRAALAGGPDVWEVIAALREAEGDEQQRVATVAEQTSLHPRQVAIALSYAADHPEEVDDRIAANETALDAAERASVARERLLA